jgi:hypothetical protein
MANHVSTWIEVQSDNKEVYQKMVDMFDGTNYDEWGDTMWWYRKLYNLDDEAEYDRGEYSDRMGTKWCYLEDVEVGDEYCQLTTLSAWDYPQEGIKQLWNILSEIDKDVFIKFTFEDESLDPVGGGGIFRDEFECYTQDMSHIWDKINEDDSKDWWEEVYEMKDDLCEEACEDLMMIFSEEDE